MNNFLTPDYSSFCESFDDLYEQLDNDDKYLIAHLRESISLEAGFGFFRTLESIMNQIYFKRHGNYPSERYRFQLAKEYLCKLFKRGIIKIKLSTPVPVFDVKLGQVTKYESKDTEVYDNPIFVEDLMDDLQKRYDILSSVKEGEELNRNKLSELIQMYCDYSILISYDDKPFYDELG